MEMNQRHFATVIWLSVEYRVPTRPGFRKAKIAYWFYVFLYKSSRKNTLLNCFSSDQAIAAGFSNRYWHTCYPFDPGFHLMLLLLVMLQTFPGISILQIFCWPLLASRDSWWILQAVPIFLNPIPPGVPNSVYSDCRMIWINHTFFCFVCLFCFISFSFWGTRIWVQSFTHASFLPYVHGGNFQTIIINNVFLVRKAGWLRSARALLPTQSVGLDRSGNCRLVRQHLLPWFDASWWTEDSHSLSASMLVIIFIYVYYLLIFFFFFN